MHFGKYRCDDFINSLAQCAKSSIFLISPTASFLFFIFIFLPKCNISLLYHKPDIIQSIVQDNINNAPLSANTSLAY